MIFWLASKHFNTDKGEAVYLTTKALGCMYIIQILS